MPRTPNSKPLTLQEQEKVKTLSASGKTPHSIAKELNRSPHTIRRYLSCPKTSTEIEAIKGELSDMFEGLAKKMLTSITDQDILKINAYQRTVSAGISTDKMRLLKGESTANIAYQDISGQLEAINQELAKYQIIDVENEIKEQGNHEKNN